MAEVMKKRRNEREERDRQWEKQRRLRAEAERQIKKELERLKLLEEHAESFTKSQYIYDLIDQVQGQIDNSNLNEKQKLQVMAWLHWATNHADGLNPVKQTIRSIFEEEGEK